MSPTRTFSEYETTKPLEEALGRAATKRSVRIVALWRHGLAEAVSMAHRYLRDSGHPREVVFARLVNDKPLAPEQLAALLQEGIRVVPVSSRYKDAVDSALQKVVLERLKTADRLLRLAQDTRPPDVDAAAARAVKEAYARLPPVTPMQRQEFLDEYYAADQSDNSVG